MYSPIRKEKQLTNQDPPKKLPKSRLNEPHVDTVKKKLSFVISDHSLPINAKSFRWKDTHLLTKNFEITYGKAIKAFSMLNIFFQLWIVCSWYDERWLFLERTFNNSLLTEKCPQIACQSQLIHPKMLANSWNPAETWE